MGAADSRKRFRRTVMVLVPRNVEVAVTLHASSSWNSDSSSSSGSTTTTPVKLILHVHKSRVLWRGLQPLLFDADRRIAQCALRILLKECFDWDADTLILRRKTEDPVSLAANTETRNISTKHDVVISEPGRDTDEARVRSRQLRLSVHKASLSQQARHAAATAKNTRSAPCAIVLWLYPPDTVQLEYLFAGLLIRWEHRIIQAQSLSGYIATLGGGFFLCHHFSTAIVLAKQQQRLAVLLNDESMYYTCWIHQAYSCIYAGKFRTANSILRQVLRAIAGDDDSVLVKMCKSARLFSKRMKKASQSTTTSSGGGCDCAGGKSQHLSNTTTLFDDFNRIRVAKDKSKANDLVVPFSKACA